MISFKYNVKVKRLKTNKRTEENSYDFLLTKHIKFDGFSFFNFFVWWVLRNTTIQCNASVYNMTNQQSG